MKPINLSAFTGVRNDVSPERFDAKDLVRASNVEIDETGKPYSRLGVTNINTTPAHSLWAGGEMCLFVQSGSLHRLLPDRSIQNLNVTITGGRVAYWRLGADVFFTDQITSGIISVTDGYRRWGIVPPTAPSITRGVGSILAGRYLVSMTYVRDSGLESGAPAPFVIDSNGSQSFVLDMPVSSDAKVVEKRVYISHANGAVLYLAASYPNATTSATITQLVDERTVPLKTLRCGPPPAGQVVGYYKGRMYVAEGNYLWYTYPYEFELIHKAMNFIGFESPIKTFSTVTDGIFIGTEKETVFLQGDDPAQFVLQPKADYGTVLGTEVNIPGYLFGEGKQENIVRAWMSKQGLCAGLDGGQLVNLTGGRYVLPEGVAKGASLLKIRGASPQLVTTLFS